MKGIAFALSYRLSRGRLTCSRNPSPLGFSFAFTWVIATTTKICTGDTAMIGVTQKNTFFVSIFADYHHVPPTQEGSTVFIYPSCSCIDQQQNKILFFLRLSGIHYRGTSIRRVSCYTLLGRWQLPWPQSSCLDWCTLFGGSVSEKHAGRTRSTVDPALPDLLTRRGPLGHLTILCLWDQKSSKWYSEPKTIAQIGSVIAVEGHDAPTYCNQSLYLQRNCVFEWLVTSDPVGHFGGNQLLGNSMSLSPPYEVQTSTICTLASWQSSTECFHTLQSALA